MKKIIENRTTNTKFPPVQIMWLNPHITKHITKHFFFFEYGILNNYCGYCTILIFYIFFLHYRKILCLTKTNTYEEANNRKMITQYSKNIWLYIIMTMLWTIPVDYN